MTGERWRGVEHQLIGFLVLPETANTNGQLLQQRLGGAEQSVTGIGQADAASAAEKQRLLKVRLKAADLLADRRLGQVQLGGRLVKTASRAAASKPRRVLSGGQCLSMLISSSNHFSAKSIVCSPVLPTVACMASRSRSFSLNTMA